MLAALRQMGYGTTPGRFLWEFAPLQECAEDAGVLTVVSGAIDCRTCGICCTVFDRIDISQEDEARLVDDDVGCALLELPVHVYGGRLQLEFPNQRCPMRAVGPDGSHQGCQCYEARPTACRIFEPDGAGCLHARLVAWERRT